MGAEGGNGNQTIGKARVSTGKNTGQIKLRLPGDLSEEFLTIQCMQFLDNVTTYITYHNSGVNSSISHGEGNPEE